MSPGRRTWLSLRFIHTSIILPVRLGCTAKGHKAGDRSCRGAFARIFLFGPTHPMSGLTSRPQSQTCTSVQSWFERHFGRWQHFLPAFLADRLKYWLRKRAGSNAIGSSAPFEFSSRFGSTSRSFSTLPQSIRRRIRLLGSAGTRTIDPGLTKCSEQARLSRREAPVVHSTLPIRGRITSNWARTMRGFRAVVSLFTMTKKEPEVMQLNASYAVNTYSYTTRYSASIAYAIFLVLAFLASK